MGLDRYNQITSDLTATFVTNENYGDEAATFTYCFDSDNGCFIFG